MELYSELPDQPLICSPWSVLATHGNPDMLRAAVAQSSSAFTSWHGQIIHVGKPLVRIDGSVWHWQQFKGKHLWLVWLLPFFSNAHYSKHFWSRAKSVNWTSIFLIGKRLRGRRRPTKNCLPTSSIDYRILSLCVALFSSFVSMMPSRFCRSGSPIDGSMFFFDSSFAIAAAAVSWALGICLDLPASIISARLALHCFSPTKIALLLLRARCCRIEQKVKSQRKCCCNAHTHDCWCSETESF